MSPVSEDVWNALRARGWRVGPHDAAVEIVAFMDYDCPFSRELETAFRETRERYSSQVAIIYRHYPRTSQSPGAFPEAVIVECAAQMLSFSGVQDRLFENSVEGAATASEVWAQMEFPENRDLIACLSDSNTVERIEEDRALMQSLGIYHVPSVFFQGQELGFTPGPDELMVLIEGEVNGVGRWVSR